MTNEKAQLDSRSEGDVVAFDRQSVVLEIVQSIAVRMAHSGLDKLHAERAVEATNGVGGRHLSRPS